MWGADVARVEFSNQKWAVKWFEDQGWKASALITNRAALRLLPHFIEPESNPLVLRTLKLLRCSLVTSLEASGKFGRLDSAAKSAQAWMDDHSLHFAKTAGAARASQRASAAAYTSLAADPDRTFAESSALSILETTNDSDATKSALAADAIDLTRGKALGPLWPFGTITEAHLTGHQQLVNYLKHGPEWHFWHVWYLGMWSGTFGDWDLAKEVVKIPDEVWENGVEAVAARIRELERAFKTQVAPGLTQVSKEVWGVETDVSIEVEPLEFAIQQVEVSLNAALTSAANNGLREDSGETLLIRSACGPYREKPSVVATSFWNACMGLDRNIGNLYPEDVILIALKNTLYTSVEELCEQDDLVRSRIGKLAALETQRYPTQEEKIDLAKVPEKVSEIITPEAQVHLQEMVDIVVSEQKPPRITRARLVNWITTLATGIDKAQKNEKRGKWLLGLARQIGGWFFPDEDVQDDDPC